MDSTLCIPHLVEFWNLPKFNTMYTKYVPRQIFEERSVCEQSSVVFLSLLLKEQRLDHIKG